MQGTRGGAYYVLPAQVPEPPLSPTEKIHQEEEQIFQLAQQEGRIKVGLCVSQLGIPAWRASRALKRLVGQGKIKAHGERRGRYYTPL